MSLKVIKAGLSDTIQDSGRYGFLHLGINPGGAMDRFAAQVTNILLGNDPHDPVIEMHFPAAAFLVEEPTVIAIGGADFSPTLNGEAIPLWQPVIVNKNSVLQFGQLKKGSRCYLGVKDGLQVNKWLNSYSANLVAAAGGFQGRALKAHDAIGFNQIKKCNDWLTNKESRVLHWKSDIIWDEADMAGIAVLKSPEWDWLEAGSQINFLKQPFIVSPAADRMGYRLRGEKLIQHHVAELVSAAVSFGSIQLLPDGQLILLMADHQTTGGYPRIAQVVTAHLSKLAQSIPGEEIRFRITDIETAEKLFYLQQQHLLQLQNACTLRWSEFLENEA